MDLKINREIRYGLFVSDFPDPKIGDRIYITSDGTNSTAILEKWEWRGNHWIDVVEASSAGILNSDFEVKIANGKTFGKYKNGDIIPGEGKTLEEFFDDVLTEVVPPTYISPSASISTNQIKYEVGEVVDIELSSSFNQNDAGSVSSVSILKNGLVVSNSELYLDENVSIPSSSSPIVYRARYDYNQGPIKNNNLGDPDPSGRIPAGNVLSNTISIYGFKKFFYGTTDEFPEGTPVDPSLIDVRSSGQYQFEDENNQEFIIQTGSEFNSFWFWVPDEYELDEVIDLDALNVNLNSQYLMYNKSINNGGGGTLMGKIYVMRQAVPYSSNHRHKVKIKLV